MKAAVCREYGPPEVLQIREIPKPSCRGGDVLVRVMAVSVNSADVRVRALAVPRWMKPLMRLVLGFNRPRKAVLGTVFAGIVEETGERVTNFRPGNRVFGMTGFRFGAFAEYLCCPENSVIAEMPQGADFHEAAALPFGWHAAIYFLQEKLTARSAQKVLIYGATASVGAAAVQLAKYYGSAVSVVCSSAGKPLMDRLGADNVVCYDRQDFMVTPARFDIIFDAVGKLSRQKCRHLLSKGGKFITTGGLSMASEHVSQLHLIRQLYPQGRCMATIDRIFPFERIADAHRYVDTGRKKGDVVLTFQTSI